MKRSPLVRKTPLNRCKQAPVGVIKRKADKAKAHKKKVKASTLCAKADALAGAFCRAQGVCTAADYPGCTCGGHIEWCHLKSRSHKTIRHDPLNWTPLCFRCHRHFTCHPDLWTKFIEEKFPGRWQRLNDILQEGGKPDYSYWLNYYRERAA